MEETKKTHIATPGARTRHELRSQGWWSDGEISRSSEWLRNPAPVDGWFIRFCAFNMFQPSFWCRISLAHPQYDKLETPQTYVGCWEQPGCFARECPVKHCLNSKSEVQEVANGSVSNAQCQHRKNVVLTSVFSFSEWLVECTTECYSG
jgi:hypothetical protein